MLGPGGTAVRGQAGPLVDGDVAVPDDGGSEEQGQPEPMPQGPLAAICAQDEPAEQEGRGQQYTTRAQVGAMWWMVPWSSAAPAPGSAEPARPVSGTGTRRRLAGLAVHSMMPMYRQAPKNAPSSPTPASSGLSLVR